MSDEQNAPGASTSPRQTLWSLRRRGKHGPTWTPVEKLEKIMLDPVVETNEEVSKTRMRLLVTASIAFVIACFDLKIGKSATMLGLTINGLASPEPSRMLAFAWFQGFIREISDQARHRVHRLTRQAFKSRRQGDGAGRSSGWRHTGGPYCARTAGTRPKRGVEQSEMSDCSMGRTMRVVTATAAFCLSFFLALSAGAQSQQFTDTICGVTLSGEIKAPPPGANPALARYLGVWTGGKWTPGNACNGFIVTEVSNDGTAAVRYVFGPTRDVPLGWFEKKDATLDATGRLRFQTLLGHSVVFQMQPDNTLTGLFTSKFGDGTGTLAGHVRKVAPPR